MKYLKNSALMFAMVLSVAVLYTGGVSTAPGNNSMIIPDVFAQTLNNEIKIAFLSDFGHVDAFNYAVDSFNHEQSTITSSNYQITSMVATVNSRTVVSEIQRLEAAGYTYFVGPLTSSASNEARQYADTKSDMVLLSPSSTAASLAIPNDSLFRLVPSDDKQVPIIMNRIQDDGKEHVVLVYRNDTWGTGIRDNIIRDYSEMVSLDILLHPDGLNSASVASQATAKVQELVTAYGSETVAVVLVSFETDTIALIEHITSNQQYTNTLDDVIWYGADGISQNSAVASNTRVASFLVSVGLTASQFGTAPNAINQVISAQNFADGGYSFANGVFDAVFLLADTIIIKDEASTRNEVYTIKSLLPDVAAGLQTHDHHPNDRTIGIGALGEFTLNSAGDLASPILFVPYEMYQKSDGTYNWRVVSDMVKVCR